jgi:DNA-binding NarL/FixJ family response regulator
VRARCLVADDHPALLQAVSEFLEAAGFELVGSASDGERAVALARETRPDAAVVDFRMPRLGGVDLVARLREAAPETRIVVYTGDADDGVVRGALGAGASAILLKEAPLPDLIRALDAVLADSTYLDPALAGFAVNADTPRPVLTERETDVLALIAEGLSHEQIGARLSISPETVRTHVRKACARLNATTRTQAVATALRLGLIS